jgi:hypothetical protein
VGGNKLFLEIVTIGTKFLIYLKIFCPVGQMTCQGWYELYANSVMGTYMYAAADLGIW